MKNNFGEVPSIIKLLKITSISVSFHVLHGSGLVSFDNKLGTYKLIDSAWNFELVIFSNSFQEAYNWNICAVYSFLCPCFGTQKEMNNVLLPVKRDFRPRPTFQLMLTQFCKHHANFIKFRCSRTVHCFIRVWNAIIFWRLKTRAVGTSTLSEFSWLSAARLIISGNMTPIGALQLCYIFNWCNGGVHIVLLWINSRSSVWQGEAEVKNGRAMICRSGHFNVAFSIVVFCLFNKITNWNTKIQR